MTAIRKPRYCPHGVMVRNAGGETFPCPRCAAGEPAPRVTVAAVRAHHVPDGDELHRLGMRPADFDAQTMFGYWFTVAGHPTPGIAVQDFRRWRFGVAWQGPPVWGPLPSRDGIGPEDAQHFSIPELITDALNRTAGEEREGAAPSETYCRHGVLIVDALGPNEPCPACERERLAGELDALATAQLHRGEAGAALDTLAMSDQVKRWPPAMVARMAALMGKLAERERDTGHAWVTPAEGAWLVRNDLRQPGHTMHRYSVPNEDLSDATQRQRAQESEEGE